MLPPNGIIYINKLNLGQLQYIDFMSFNEQFFFSLTPLFHNQWKKT